MRTEAEILEKLNFLEAEFADGLDPEATREIERLKWILELGPDHIHVPKIG